MTQLSSMRCPGRLPKNMRMILSGFLLDEYIALRTTNGQITANGSFKFKMRNPSQMTLICLYFRVVNHTIHPQFPSTKQDLACQPAQNPCRARIVRPDVQRRRCAMESNSVSWNPNCQGDL